METLAPLIRTRGGVELSSDVAFSKRVIRLGLTSVVALGAIYVMARSTAGASRITGASLASGWLLMPSILFLSLWFPAVRYALVIPATLVTVPLMVITALALQAGSADAIGWLLITVGVLLGGLLGMWFWFRWIPVPRSLDDPFSRGRWLLIGAHVMLIVTGLIVVGAK
jgi:hypothetical protein